MSHRVFVPLDDFYFPVTFLEASKTRPSLAPYRASSQINLTKKEKFVQVRPEVSMSQPTLPSPMPPRTAPLQTSQPTGTGFVICYLVKFSFNNAFGVALLYYHTRTSSYIFEGQVSDPVLDTFIDKGRQKKADSKTAQKKGKYVGCI